MVTPSGQLNRRTVLRAGLVAGSALALPGLLTACRSGGSAPGTGTSDGPAARGGTLRMAINATAESDAIDVTRNSDYLGGARILATYERLCDAGSDGSVVPRLYESLDVVGGDPRRWSVRLKPNVRYADGTPMRASDVVASISAQLQTEAGTSLSAYDPAASTAVDDRTATLVFATPVADLPTRLGSSFLVVLPGGKPATTPEQVNGSGPYRVESFTAGRRTVLTRRQDYWDGDARGFADRIELVGIADPKARLQALRSGQVDAAHDVEYLDGQSLAGNPQITVHRSSVEATYVWFMNMTVAPFDNPLVRQAFKFAVDRRKIVDTVFYGFGDVGNDLWGKGQPFYAGDIPQRPFDPAQARALLARAGTPRVSFPILTAPTEPAMAQATQLMADQVEAAGFDVTVRTLTADAYYASARTWTTLPSVSFTQPFGFVGVAPLAYLADGPFNFGWKRPDWDTRFTAAAGVVDPRARQAVYTELQRSLWDDGPDLVWGVAPKLIAATSAFRGFERSPNFTVFDPTGVSRQ